MKRKTYTGALNERIFVDPARWGDDSIDGNVQRLLTEKQRRYRARIQGKQAGKWELLFEHYGIDEKIPGASERLLWALVYDHVPGIQQTVVRARGRGAPTKRTPAFRAAVVEAVDNKRTELQSRRSASASKVTNEQAIQSVYEDYPASLGKKPGKLGAFRTLYYQCLEPPRSNAIHKLMRMD